MSAITDEGQMRAARLMMDAAEKAARAADTMEQAVRRLEVLVEDGYGGNVPKLLEALAKQERVWTGPR
jgi:hypothetical protein